MFYVLRFKDDKFVKVQSTHQTADEAVVEAYNLNNQYCYNAGIDFVYSDKGEL